MNNITCSYCGSSLGSGSSQGGKSYCGFCQMDVEPSINGERIDHYKEAPYISHDHIKMNTPQLLQQNTKTLLHLLKFMREERTSHFNSMRVLKEACRRYPDSSDFKNAEKEASEMYEHITRKCNVTETILRDRLGYIPKKITNDMLINYHARCQEPYNEKKMPGGKPEIHREQRKEMVRLVKTEGIAR